MVAEAGFGCTVGLFGAPRSCMTKLGMGWTQTCTTSLIFVASIFFMAMKPILLHLTVDKDIVPYTPAQFQVAVEATKTLLCAVALSSCRIRGIQTHLWHGWSHSAAFAQPAGLYLLMNILVVRAARMLPPPTFQLLANTKILCTAVAACTFNSRSITVGQWVALILLTFGVAVGDWRGGSGDMTWHFGAPPVGIAIMLFNSCLSAYAGVLMERRLKAPETKDMTIFETNFHTASYTLILNVVSLIVLNSNSESSVLPNRLPVAADVAALINEAVNGILMSLLMRRLDSIAKNFAFSLSVFVTAGLSAAFLGYEPHMFFYVGAALTAMAGVLYSYKAAPPSAATVKKQS